MHKCRVILASKSPRRKELLEMLDIPFVVSNDFKCEEIYPDDIKPEMIPQYLSSLKSDAYPFKLKENDILLTADTIVISNDVVLGKPKNHMDAFSMLKNLEGRTHKVVTGVTLRNYLNKKESFSETSYVTFRHLNDDELRYYVNKYNPLDKAGAYGIQEWIGVVGISSISGSYYNIVGLPTEKVYTELQKFM